MAELTSMDAQMRDRSGKGAARAARRAGRVPAVIYGGNEEPIMITVDPKTLWMAMRQPGFFSTQYRIEAEGQAHQVLARDVQFHPVTDAPLHVDFLRVTDRTSIKVSVPVTFINEEDSPGLRRGGVLNVVRYEIEVISAVVNIPDQLVVDLDGLDIGDSIHISAIDLGEGVKPVISDRDFTVATIAAPTVVSDEAAAEAEGEEEELEGEELEGAEAPEGEEAEESGGTEGKDSES